VRRPTLIALGWLWVVVVLAVVPLGRFAVYYFHTPAGRDGESITVDIPAGASLYKVALLLKEKGVVDSPRLFTLSARLTGQDRKIRSGEYGLSPRLSPSGVIKALTESPPLLHPVTIAEGQTFEEIAQILNEAGLAKEEDFIAKATDPGLTASLGIPAPNVEGYLFPDTYRLPRGLEPEDIIRLMVSRFREVYAAIKSKAPHGAGLDTYETVTLASLVEAETSAAHERALVSAVFLNRLERRMPLQCDPTVIYGLEELKGPLKKVHLRVDHPYNTYIHDGLPPGPINNPGKAALKAALNPDDVDFLYFVSRGDGTHQFSKNYRQHRKAVSRFRRSR